MSALSLINSANPPSRPPPHTYCLLLETILKMVTSQVESLGEKNTDNLWRNEDVPSSVSQCESHHVPEYFISVILLNKKKITLENKEAPLHGALALVGVYFFEEELNVDSGKFIFWPEGPHVGS